jgi:hypothetical protein
MKILALLFCLSIAAMAAPTLVQSPYCTAPDLYCIDTVGSTPTSIRMFMKFDVSTDRYSMQCGLPGWVTPDVQHDIVNTDSATQGRWINIGGLAPSTTYECRGGAAATGDASHTYTWTGRLTYTTPARETDSWDAFPDPVKPDTAYPTVTGSSLSATCGTLQAQLDAAAALNQSLTHEVVLPAGSHCVGNFVVRNHKTGPGYLILRSSAVGTSSFPPEGVRVDPTRYPNQFAYLRNPAKTIGFAGGLLDADSTLLINDGTSYVRLVGIAFEPEPTTNQWVYRDGTCTFNSGSDINVNVAASGGQPHFLSSGRTVKVLTAATLGGLVGNTYTVTNVDTNNFTLNSTSGVTGSTGSCRVAVLADAYLTSCTSGTSGAPRCTTNVPHGLVTDNVVKVIGDISAGFSSRTQYVDVIDASTLEFRGSTYSGSYTPNSARVVADGSVSSYSLDIVRGTPLSTHIILDRVWNRQPGIPYRAYMGMRIGCDYCAMVESYIEPNGQWTFAVPGTLTEQRSFGYSTNGYNVNIDNANEGLWLRNNYIGFHVLGAAGGSSTNSTLTRAAHWITYNRNTFEFPESFRANLTNPLWDGLMYLFNRQGVEWKTQEESVYRGNRFYGNQKGLDKGSPFLISNRAGLVSNNRNKRILFEYNTTASSHDGPVFAGEDTADQPRGTPMGQSLIVRHNIFLIDGNKTGNGSTGFGNCFAMWSWEDLVYDHNLCINRGNGQSIISFGNGGPATGLKVTNNILTYNQTAGSQAPIWKASGILATGNNEWEWPSGAVVRPVSNNDAWSHWRTSVLAVGQTTPVVIGGTSYPHLDPTSTFSNNALVTGTETTSASCDTSTTSGCNASKTECETAMGTLLTAYGPNICWDAGQSAGASLSDTWVRRLAKVGFGVFDWTARYRSDQDVANNRAFNFKLMPTSPFKSGFTSATNSLCSSGLCMKSTDGSDLGPDMEALEVAQGLVFNPRVHSIGTTTATVAYKAPDSAACYVDYWSGSATPTRVSDGGGARNRNVTLTGLTSGGTVYNYVVQCAVEQPTGTFQTK